MNKSMRVLIRQNESSIMCENNHRRAIAPWFEGESHSLAYLLRRNPDAPKWVIDGAFDWETSPQGFEYWRRFKVRLSTSD